MRETFWSKLEDPARREALMKQLYSDLRKDIGLRLLLIAPTLPFVEFTAQGLQDYTGLSREKIADYTAQFLRLRLWVEHHQSIQLAKDEFIRLGRSSELEHLSATMGLSANLSENGQCWYDNFLLGTTSELKREFYRTVYDAIRLLIQKSKDVKEYDSVVAWSHQGFDCRHGWNQEFKENKNETK